MTVFWIIYLSGIVPAYYVGSWGFRKTFGYDKKDREWGDVIFHMVLSILSWFYFAYGGIFGILNSINWPKTKPPKWL